MARNKTLVRFMAIAVAATTLSTSAPAYAAFDADYYAKQNPDVVAAFGSSAKALENHYNLFGKKEGRAGSSEDLKNSPLRQLFDAAFYAKQNPDVVAAFGNNEDALFQHFLIFGIKEGRQINQYFDVKAYKAAYPDLAEKFGDNMELYYKHFVAYGQQEHRTLGGFPSENIPPTGTTAVATAAASSSSGGSSSGGSSSSTKPSTNKPGLKDATIAKSQTIDLTKGYLTLPKDVDPSKVTFSADNANVTVSGSEVTGESVGTVTITADLHDNTDSSTKYTCTITVVAASIKLNKTNLDVAVGKTEDLKDEVDAYGSSDYSWTTSNSAVATVSNGIVTGKKAGTADITARITVDGTDYKAVCKVTVTSPYVKLNETSLTMELEDAPTQLTATTLPSKLAAGDKDVTFESSNANVATVDSDDGTVTAVGVGTTVVTAKAVISNITYTATCNVTVKPVTPEIKIDKTTATVTVTQTTTLATTSVKPAAASTSVKWRSSDDKIASVDQSGEVTGVAPGTATITAEITIDKKTYKAECKVTVNAPSITITGKPTANIKQSAGLTLGADTDPSGEDVTWSCDDDKVTINNGSVTFSGTGEFTITATIEVDGKTYSDTCTVTVDEDE